jgi:hypothetical protein
MLLPLVVETPASLRNIAVIKSCYGLNKIEGYVSE